MRKARLFVISIILLILSLSEVLIPNEGSEAFAADSIPRTDVEFLYGQSPDFWGALIDMQNAEGSIPDLYKALNNRYGTYEEAFSRFRIGMYDIPIHSGGLPPGESMLKRYYFELSSEALGWVSAEDPVVSEMHAHAVALGIFKLGVSGSLPDSDVQTSIGIVAGFGDGRRADGASSDFLQNFPMRSEAVQLFGLDLSLKKKAILEGWLGTGFTAQYQGSMFISNLAPTWFANRWKLYSYIEAGQQSSRGEQAGSAWDMFHEPSMKDSFGLHAVAGPQPLPIDILPRSWDYIHEPSFFPDLRAMLGAGLHVKVPLTKKEDPYHRKSPHLKFVGGFYGGYWGGGLLLDSKYMQFHLGTWGVGASSTYQWMSQRIGLGSITFKLY